MRAIVATAFWVISAVVTSASELAYLYKDPKIMGRGGADIAVGGVATALFSNPAGLATSNTDDIGYELSFLPVALSATEDFKSFYEDVKDVDKNDYGAVGTLLDEYSGKTFHIGGTTYSSFTTNLNLAVISIGVLGGSDANYIIHANGSVNGATSELVSRGYLGLLAGVAIPMRTRLGLFSVGMGAKYIELYSYEGPIYMDDFGQGNLGEHLQNKFSKYTYGSGLDMGVTFSPAFIEELIKTSFGLSVLNVGTINDMGKQYGYQPMTVNAGVAIEPWVPVIERFIIAADYVDILNANKNRVYDYTGVDNAVAYTDYTDTDINKRLKIGMELVIADNEVFGLSTSVGHYQKDYTAGVSLRLSGLELNFSTYKEQLGTGDVDLSDRRYMAQVNITFGRL